MTWHIISRVSIGVVCKLGRFPGEGVMRLRPWMAATAIVILIAAACAQSPQAGDGLPLRKVSEIALTGGPVRFDYTALDPGRGRLFVAHMGASELIDVDVRAH